MAKKKKKKKGKAAASPAPKPLGDRISQPFAEALKSVSLKAPEGKGKAAVPAPAKPARKAPVAEVPPQLPEAGAERILPEYSYEDRAAYLAAFGAVRPLGSNQPTKAKKVVKAPRVDLTGAKAAADEQARASLGSLVADGIRFEVNKASDGMIDAYRTDAEAKLRELRQGKTTPEAQIDLHGLRAKEATTRLVRFLRQAKSERRRFVLVIHGKGTHSQGGEAVLREEVYACLSKGAGAPLVDAFTHRIASTGGNRRDSRAPENMIRAATEQDRDAVTSVLTAALAQDPFSVWLTDGGDVKRLGAYTRLMFDLTLELGQVRVVDDQGIRSAALFASSAAWHLDLGAQLTVIPKMVRVVGLGRFFRVTETLDHIARSRPPAPWRLLALIGTHPDFTRSGHGSVLMNEMLAESDERQEECVLETSVEANVKWYRKFGFTKFRSVPVSPKTTLHMMRRQG